MNFFEMINNLKLGIQKNNKRPEKNQGEKHNLKEAWAVITPFINCSHVEKKAMTNQTSTLAGKYSTVDVLLFVKCAQMFASSFIMPEDKISAHA